MNQKYSNMFIQLTRAYLNDNLEAEISRFLENPETNKIELANVISSLCGVHVDFSSNYYNELVEAIKKYNADTKIVERVRDCDRDCTDTEQGLCQRSCPFNAILSSNDNLYIDKFKCTDCGFCVSACPNGNILDKIEFMPIVDLLKSEGPVVAAVAPSIIGQYGDDVSLDQLRAAFIKLGFTDMIEVAFFADMLSLKEAVEFNEHVSSLDDFLITSCCCPMWFALIKRSYNDFVKHVTPSLSPMCAAGRVMKVIHPQCKVVFIGPCIAKKSEAKAPDLKEFVDFVLTYDEVKDIFDAAGITPGNLAPVHSANYASKGGRIYARTGGVSTAIKDVVDYFYPEKSSLFKSMKGNGIKECKDILSKLQEGDIDATFVEGMGCVGGCAGGPKKLISAEENTIHINRSGDESSIKVPVTSGQMKGILSKINIHDLEDFKDLKKVDIFHRDIDKL